MLKLIKNAKLLSSQRIIRFLRSYILNKRNIYYPRSAEVALTYRCNFKCKHCNATTIKAADPLKTDDWLSFFKQFDQLGGLFVTFTGGEPSLREDLPELIHFISKKTSLLATLISNGTVEEHGLLDKLIDAGLYSLSLSLYGSESFHDKFTGVNGSYNKLIKVASYACKRIPVNLLGVPTSASLKKGEFQHVQKLAKKMKIPLRINLPTYSGRIVDNKKDLLDKTMIKQIHQMYQKGIVSTDATNHMALNRCPATLSAFYITAHGDYTPCPFIQFSYGNIKYDKLLDIYKQVRESQFNCVKFKKWACPPAEDVEFIEQVLEPMYKKYEIPVKAEDFNELKEFIEKRKR